MAETSPEEADAQGSQTVQKSLDKAPPKDAQPSAQGEHSAKGWKWTRKKRKAVRLIVQGWNNRRIAEELGVHRNTVRTWKATQEFRAAVITEASEYTQRTRFKRVHETGVITDQIVAQVARSFKQLKDQKGELNQTQLNAMQTFMREYREFREQERADFGDARSGGGGGLSVNFNLGGMATSDPTAGAKGAQSFKRFVEENMEKIPTGLIEQARTPGEALVLATRALVQETSILDDLYEEDKAADTAKAKESKK